MTSIIFGKMIIDNFMSYGHEEFDFEKHRGMNLITGTNFDIENKGTNHAGHNGCGKSSIGNALVYALYGQLPFRLNAENIINRYVQTKDMSVSIEFKVDRKKYRIISGLHGKQSYCDVFEIIKGEEHVITKSTTKETRAFIETSILRCDMRLFMRTVLLNSNQKFNFYTLTKAEKTDFINSLFDINLFGDMYDLCHADKLKMEKEITVHNSKLMILNKNADDYNSKRMDFEKEIGEERTRLSEELSAYQSKLDDLVKKNVTQNKEESEKYKKGKEKVINKLNDMRTKLKVNNTMITSGRKNISSLELQLKKFSDMISKHDELKNQLCNDCQGIFSKYYKLDHYQQEIDKIRKSINETNDNINELSSSNKSINDTIAECNRILPQIEQRITDATSEYEKYCKSIQEYNSLIKITLDKLNGLNIKKNPYEKLISENKSNIDTEQSELDIVTKQYKLVVMIENIVKHDNIKKMVIRDMVGILNKNVKNYLHQQGANYDVEFDDDMDSKFITNSSRPVDYPNFSSGEQARISIATCFAFRDFLSIRSNISSNILIIDEFIDGNIDSMAIDSILKILSGFVKINKQNVFIISHRNEVKENSMFNQIIEIDKKENVSSIKYISDK